MSLRGWSKFWGVTLLVLSATPALAINDRVPQGYRQVAAEYAIPPALLYAIALTESEDNFQGVARPWPWTINHAGKGTYFKTRQDAYQYAQKLVEQGVTSFDIGLMQVNWRWHKQRFPSLWDAFDPYLNLHAAAQILIEQYTARGSFEEAVGAYHAPNNAELATQYRERVRHKLHLLIRGHR